MTTEKGKLVEGEFISETRLREALEIKTARALRAKLKHWKVKGVMPGGKVKFYYTTHILTAIKNQLTLGRNETQNQGENGNEMDTQ